ncbi:MAG: hypothetical protein LBF34_02100 [Puniceicoccales bacterium]|jgi:uncharacterized FAD-dependent dehydrogenase|nr:hypothetical protein [Puniceicoccales bacterium]
MNRKISLYIVLGLGLFNVPLFGDPPSAFVQSVRDLERQINSGELNSVQVTDTMTRLIDLSLANFDSLPDNLKNPLRSQDNDLKRCFAYNIFRLYAFPTNPSKIRNVMDDLFFRTESIAKLSKKEKENLLSLILILNVGRENQDRFREIITSQGQDVLKESE